jgi:hypothetical protein
VNDAAAPPPYGHDMATATQKETQMKRRKRITLKMVALGFAAAAFAAPVAQAIPEGMQGSDLQVLHSGGTVVSPDDRAVHGTTPPVVTSPDDRAIHGATSVKPTPQPVSVDGGNGFELSNGVLTGIVLGVLAAVMAGYAARQIRRGKLASA